jgi:hypothetical protein
MNRLITNSGMDKVIFESVLRYYIWGGKEAYNIRQKMRERTGSEDGGTVELPAWDTLAFAGLVVNAPQNVLSCADAYREISIRAASGANANFDKRLSEIFKAKSRIRQFSAALGEHLGAAGGLPKEMAKRVQEILFSI